VILLASIPIGIVLGLVLRGRLSALGGLHFAWAPIAIIGLLVQVALFTPSGESLAGGLSSVIYVASTAAVFVAVARNLRTTGMPIVALGALSNLLAITANGGAMPTTSAALATAGLDGPGAYTNSVVVPNPLLQPLTDIFAIPAGVPLSNVFSVGDVLIGLGIVLVIVAAMRRPPTSSDGLPAAGSPAGT
jgi:lipoprotein signal peptidase